MKRAVSPASIPKPTDNLNSTPHPQLRDPPHPIANNSQTSGNLQATTTVVPGINAASSVGTGLNSVIGDRAQDTDRDDAISIQNKGSSLSPTGRAEENSKNENPHDPDTNSLFPQPAPPVKPQTPDVVVEASTSQSHPVERCSTEELVPPASHSSLHDDKGVTSTASLAKSPSLWERTLEIAEAMLRDHGLPALDRNIKSTSCAENIQSVIGTLKTAQGDYQAQGDDQKEKSIGRERLRRILRAVEKYTKIVDTAVQHSPEVMALVWAGIRGILQISLNHLDTVECLEETMTTIMMKVSMCEFYAGIYEEAIQSMSNSKVLEDTLFSALPQFHASVIVFSIKAREYFHATLFTKIQNLFKPFNIEFGPFIDEINAKEKVIRECADGATMDRIKRMESQIGDIKSEIQPLVQLNQEIATKATENLKITKEIHNTVLDDTTRELLRMLSPLKPLKRHDDLKLTRVDNTGAWLLQLPSFCNWSNSAGTDLIQQTDRVFCCYGMPGAGKTMMSSIVIDDLISRLIKPSTIKIGIAYLYCDYRDQNAQTLVHILGTLLQQFLRSIPIPQDVRNTLENNRKKDNTPNKDDLLALLQTTLQHLERAFICIDALDELETKTRSQLLQALNQLVAHSNGLRIFLTGRKHIQDEVQKLSKTSVDIVAHQDDIRSYLKREIAEDENPEDMDEALQNEIVDTLVKRSQQMFLLPALHIKMVLEMPTKAKRRKALQTLPPDLYNTFEAVIARIQKLSSYKAKLGMQVLMWLHLAFRPLELTELQHALSVETGQAEFDPDNIPSQKVILDCCLGLVILDEETRTIRFVHYTLEEYFRGQADKYFPNGCCTAAEICLTYLNFRQLAPHCATTEELKQKMEKFAFLKYAAVNWGHYVAQKSNDLVKKLALTLLEQIGRTSCPLQVLYCLLPDVEWDYSYKNGSGYLHQVANMLSGVHAAAQFGLVECLQCLFPMMGADMKDDTCRTPLSWAAGKGHEKVVQLLLGRDDVDVNTQDTDYGQTSLAWAAEQGHERVVQLLLERDDVEVNTRSKSGQTPLSLAAEQGHEKVVQLLLARNDVDVNKQDTDYGQTPLSLAAENGREKVVQLLLGRDDVDVNKQDTDYGRTPLSLAAEQGREKVVQLLLARNDVDVNTQDTDYGRTPLSWAAERGHEKVVQLLLGRDDVDVNIPDASGKTAAESPYVAKYLQQNRARLRACLLAAAPST